MVRPPIARALRTVPVPTDIANCTSVPAKRSPSQKKVESMWGIGEAKVRKGIAQKEVTKVVNTTGRRYRMV